MRINEKPIIEQAMEKGCFRLFKDLRDMMYKPETLPKLKYGGTGLEIMSTKYKNLRYAKHTDGWTEVANKDLELLGVLYYYKKWKKWVWEQCPKIIMAQDCLNKVSELITKFKDNENK